MSGNGHWKDFLILELEHIRAIKTIWAKPLERATRQDPGLILGGPSPLPGTEAVGKLPLFPFLPQGEEEKIEHLETMITPTVP